MQVCGAYETTTPLTAKFRGYIREVAELTADDELLRIAELPEVPVSLENCRQLDPQERAHNPPVVGSSPTRPTPQCVLGSCLTNRYRLIVDGVSGDG